MPAGLRLKRFLSYRLAGFLLRRGLLVSRSPASLLWLNFLGGFARGAGMAFGTTVIVALFFYLLSRLTWLPWLTEFLAALMERG